MNEGIRIKKMDGSLEIFDKEKLIRAITATGAPREVAIEIADKVEKKIRKGVSTAEIRRMVLDELEKRNPEWSDNWLFYDRIVKKRVTFEKGKFVEVKKGHLYLGREVKDIGKKGLSDLEEIKGIIDELEEDLKHGIPPRTISSRSWVLFMAVLKSKELPKKYKEKAIEMINEFRRKHGWKALEPKKPL